MLDRLLGFFSCDLGIDLGTANTLVLVKGKGIVIREPTVVAINKKTKEVYAVGAEAKRMLGKTPQSIIAIRPLRDGVISDFHAVERLLSDFIGKVHSMPSRFPKIPKPRVVIGIPSGITEVERKAVIDAAISAGARLVYLLEEPMAASIGAGLPISEPQGNMIVDMGGGTTEIAVISLGGVVTNKSIRVAGDEMDQEIVNYARSRYNLLVGERTAEEIKVMIGNACPYEGESEDKAMLRGRDLRTGLPKSVEVSAVEIRESLRTPLHAIVNAIKDAIEDTPPELVSDILKNGITLAGGTSLIGGIHKFISEETRMPVFLAKDPLSCVVRGCGEVLNDFDLLKRVKV
ncbi:rod shape-determining protein [candidate division WWE3 bacterium]|nr:rod shape-determining protein [candidate division WWE3 bacterium]